MDWRQFFDGEHSLYVDARHKALHADLVARGVLALLPPGSPRILDWGCGEADAATTIAARCATLYLFDSAPRVRASLHARYGSAASIRVLDEDSLANLDAASLDGIVIVSVLQYLGRDTLADVLDQLRPKLVEGGRLILGDIIPRDVSAVEDAKALLAFGWQGGFLMAALLGLVKTFFSNYRTLRDMLGLTRWDDAELIEFLDYHGFSAGRVTQNIGHNQARHTFVATRVR